MKEKDRISLIAFLKNVNLINENKGRGLNYLPLNIDKLIYIHKVLVKAEASSAIIYLMTNILGDLYKGNPLEDLVEYYIEKEGKK